MRVFKSVGDRETILELRLVLDNVISGTYSKVRYCMEHFISLGREELQTTTKNF